MKAVGQLTTTGLRDDPGDVSINVPSGPILGGNINAAGSVSLNGESISFGTIFAAVNGTIISSLDISGGQVSVGNDLFIQSNFGNLSLGEVSGRAVDLEASNQLTVPQVNVRDELTLRAQIIDGAVQQDQGVTQALQLVVTGPRGALAQDVDLHIGAPNGLLIQDLASVDATLVTTANTLFGQFDISDRMLLQTAETTLLLDNDNPAPRKGIDVQLYQPGGRFFLAENGTVSITNTYVIAYLQAFQTFSAAFTDDHIMAFPEFDGTSITRDAVWNTAANLRKADAAKQSDDAELQTLLSNLRLQTPLVAVKPGLSGPAVNLNR